MSAGAVAVRPATCSSRRTDPSNKERFKETTRLRHDFHALAKGWELARPMLEIRLHSDVEF